ncbi:MAG: hypothetical protein QXW73_09165, partial [Nitrososphaerales archaeon]
IDPDSEQFDKEYDARTFSEQGFSVGKGSLNLDSLKQKGIVCYIAFSMHMHCYAVSSEDGCRDRETRSDEMHKMLPRVILCYVQH